MNRRLTLLVSLLALVTITQITFAEQPDYMRINVYYEDKQGWQDLNTRGLDITFEGPDFLEVAAVAEELDALQQDGFRTEIITESLKELFRSRLDRSKLMGGYKTLAEINAYLDNMIADHPDLVSAKHHIGYTLEGRDMWAVKISDNPNVDEDEPEILYCAAIHAREVITPEVLFHFMDHMTDAYGVDPEVAALVDDREMWFIIPVNPDGYYHNEVIAPGGGGMWRKNRRDNGDGTFGVDLNRNYGLFWGYDDFGSSPQTDNQTYRGTGPFSEPETQNMRDFSIARDFVIAVYFHAYGNVIYIPWEYNSQPTPDHDVYMAMGNEIFAMNGFPSYLAGINGSTGDWHYGEQTLKNKTFGTLFEVGTRDDYFWPDPARIPALVESCLEPCKYLALVADSIYDLKVPQMPTADITPGAEVGDYTVEWQHTDSLNPAVQYTLVEFQQPRRILDSAENSNNWYNWGFSVTSLEYHSASQCLYSGTGNNYRSYIQSAFPLFVEEGDSLKFWAQYVIERNADFAYVEVSTDGQTFTPIPGNLTTNNNPFGTNRGNGITGGTIGWVQGLFDLSDFAGEAILIRLIYETDENYAEEGIYFDDIEPVMVFDSAAVVDNAITDTHYDFAAKPDGAYYYMVWAQDAQDQYSTGSFMTYTVVDRSPSCCLGATGNVDCSPEGIVDITDVQILVDHLFLTLADLCCVDEANINYPESGYTATDETVDVTDLSILIDNQFLSLSPLSDCP
ncbi:MAG: hypothetical protein GY867_00785 [bacterium]|nr:hypothetical protein [bacterium]